MNREKQEAEFYCPRCGWVNEPIKEQSNKNWSVVNPNCDKCGTPNTIRLKTSKKNINP